MKIILVGMVFLLSVSGIAYAEVELGSVFEVLQITDVENAPVQTIRLEKCYERRSTIFGLMVERCTPLRRGNYSLEKLNRLNQKLNKNFNQDFSDFLEDVKNIPSTIVDGSLLAIAMDPASEYKRISSFYRQKEAVNEVMRVIDLGQRGTLTSSQEEFFDYLDLALVDLD